MAGSGVEYIGGRELGYPDVALRVRTNAADEVGRQKRAGGASPGIVDKTVPGPIVHAQCAAAGPYPEVARLIFVQCEDLIGPQAGGVTCTAPVNGKIRTVELVQAIIGGEPHEPIPVLDDRIHGIGKQPIVGAQGSKVQVGGLGDNVEASQQAKEWK